MEDNSELERVHVMILVVVVALCFQIKLERDNHKKKTSIDLTGPDINVLHKPLFFINVETVPAKNKA